MKKVRKPREMWDMFVHNETIIMPIMRHKLSDTTFEMNLWYAKRLHTWLGKAIAYLESRK